MARKRVRSTAQLVVYVLSAIVALSMVLGLLGPVLIQTAEPPTPTWLPTSTWPPTWTPIPTTTPSPTRPAATLTATALPPTATPTLLPTATLTPTLTPSPTLQADTGQPWSFAVVGDSRGNEPMYKRVLQKTVQDGNTFLVHTGDMVEQGNSENLAALHKLMADFPLPFYPVPGSHELDKDGSLTSYLAWSGAPAVHYSFDFRTVHLTMVNSASGYLDEDELAWIDQDLAATDQPVKMVFLHFPPFDPDGTDYVMYSGNDALIKLMEKHRVNYVFAGHIHAYSRAERNGTVYVITGGAGAPLYTSGHPNSFYHYVRVIVNGERVQIEVIRLD